MADEALLARPSVREVLGVLPPDAEEAARAAVATMTSGRMPWYLRVLIGAGAWIGASFLLSAILSLILMAAGEQMNSLAIIIGVVFIAGSIPMRRRVGTSPFLTQLALVISSTGQILIIGGIGAETHEVMAASGAAIFTSLVLIGWFPDRVQRFSATLVVFGAMLTIVIEHRIPHGMDPLAVLAVILMLVLCRFAPRALMVAHAELVEPVVYGLAIALIGFLTIHTVVSIGEIFNETWGMLGLFSIGAFNLALLALAVSIFIEQGVSFSRPEVLGALGGLVLLGAITRSTPGVVATLLLLVLGFDRRARGLIALGASFFLGFGAAYYYDMRLTLLQKSGVLALSGAVCLLAWVVVRMGDRSDATARP
jgi:uncharacterized membrane protein